MPLINLKHAEMFVEGLDHPEGVALGPDGNIYAGGEAGQVYRIDYEQRGVEAYADTGGLNLGMALDAAANVYICTADRGAVYKVTPAGEVSQYSAGSEEQPDAHAQLSGVRRAREFVRDRLRNMVWQRRVHFLRRARWHHQGSRYGEQSVSQRLRGQPRRPIPLCCDVTQPP